MLNFISVVNHCKNTGIKHSWKSKQVEKANNHCETKKSERTNNKAIYIKLGL